MKQMVRTPDIDIESNIFILGSSFVCSNPYLLAIENIAFPVAISSFF